MKKIIIIVLSILYAQANYAQNNVKLKRDFFERDMVRAEKRIASQLKKGDSTYLAEYAYILKRLHNPTKSFEIYSIAYSQGKLKDQTYILDLINLAKQNGKSITDYNAGLIQAGYAESFAAKSYTQLAVIENACFNGNADDIACLGPNGKLMLASTRATIKDNIQNSLLKVFTIGDQCEVNLYSNDAFNKTVGNKNHVGPIHFSGKFVFVTRSCNKPNKEGIYNLEVLYAIDNGNGFESYVPLPINNSSYSVQHAYFNESNSTVYFSSNMPGGKGGFDLYKMKYNASNFIWGNPENITEVNTAADEVFPTMDKNGNLYYSTTTINGPGGLDIHCLKNGSQKPQVLAAPINSSFDDFYFHINDQMKGSFTSNRGNGKGGDDVYTFSIDTTPYKVCFQVVDSASKENLKNANVKMKYNNQSVNSVSDENGRVCLSIPALDYSADMDINLMAEKNGYVSTSIINTPKFTNSREQLAQVMLPKVPAPIQPPVPVAKIKVGQDLGKLLNLNPIYFDLGKWDVRPDAAVELDKIVKAMEEFPTLVIELGSHTDSRSSATFNQTLSQKRAESSGRYILSKGIDPKRLTWKGYGESKLLNKCKDGVKCSEQDHAKNRRTEFKIIKM